MIELIYKTLAYADIFDYPLTKNEIEKFFITKTPLGLTSLPVGVNQKNGYYFLKGREKIVEIRKKRTRWSREKTKIGQKIATRLGRLIPFIKMIGFTGSLAMNNARLHDDIDFLVITARNRLWLTRLMAVVFLEIFGCRRRPGALNFNNKICLNMLLDENHLVIPSKEQDLFTAHEIAQLKPIYNKGQTYEKFIWANLWVKKYLPMAIEARLQKNDETKKKGNKFLNIFEYLAYKCQLAYMKSRKTIEITQPHRILFHPHDCRGWILKEYNQRLNEYLA